MILRRVIRHFQKQEWTAICLDFLIVVLAVLSTAEFRNVVAVKWDIATDLRNIILAVLDDARKVEAVLEAELQGRG